MLNLKRFDREKGFTMVEIMVVIVIIGIIAAIAVPIYFNAQKESLISTLRTDVTNLAIAVGTKVSSQEFDAFGEGKSVISFPASERTNFQSAGNTLSIRYNSTDNTYCVQGTRTINTTNDTRVFYNLSTKRISDGTCPSAFAVQVT